MNKTYSVKQLAKLAGVSIKTLHLYDKLGLLKPAVRTDARYRLYQEKELLRLQQVLFYKELDFPLKEIRQILDDPDFDLIKALEGHKKLLHIKKVRINTLLKTLDNTIHSLKNKTMLNLNELYDGLSREEAMEYRVQAVIAYGDEVVTHAEGYLKTLNKEDMQLLVARQKELGISLFLLKDKNPEAEDVQQLVHQHYLNTRKLWGTHNAKDKQAAAYKGLGQLYLTDERFTSQYGKPDPAFNIFICAAMACYSDHYLQ
jgi:DNA-binding transcriptional MerR regulator